MGNTGTSGEKLKPGARVSFGDGRLKGEILDVVEEGNRLVKFEYEGILRKCWTAWEKCPFRRISPTN